jgi:type IV pilus assembly protein PilP
LTWQRKKRQLEKKVLPLGRDKEFNPMRILFISLVLVLPWILGGCGGEPPKPAKVPMPPPEQKSAGREPAPKQLPPLLVSPPVTPEITSYSYNPKGKPDPFRPLVVEKIETPVVKKAQAKKTPGTPLEKVDLAELKLVALIWDIPKPRAMVEDASGKGYILTVGTYVGKNGGKITKIDSTGAIVSERYETDPGKFKIREIPLRLYAE